MDEQVYKAQSLEALFEAHKQRMGRANIATGAVKASTSTRQKQLEELVARQEALITTLKQREVEKV